jgi:hypothetical protein
MRAVLLAAVLCAGAAPAAADVYTCRTADGGTRYVGDASQCPGAQKHELTGQVQRAPGPPEAPVETFPVPARRSAPAAPAPDEEAAARAWREKRIAAEQQLAQVQARLADAEAMLRWCNRGGEMYAESRTTGLRRHVSCDEVEEAYGRLRVEEGQLEHYLAEGLEEECRRAGCLPGWVR